MLEMWIKPDLMFGMLIGELVGRLLLELWW